MKPEVDWLCVRALRHDAPIWLSCAMKDRYEALYCVLVVIAAALVSIAKCTGCKGPKSL